MSRPAADTGPQQDPQIVTEWIEVPAGPGQDGAGGLEPSSGGAGSGEPMPTYMARPPGRAPGPAVLVGFEMFGVTGYVRIVTERLARAGYVAIAPDFSHRHSTGGYHIELAADAGGRTRGRQLIGDLRREQGQGRRAGDPGLPGRAPGRRRPRCERWRECAMSW